MTNITKLYSNLGKLDLLELTKVVRLYKAADHIDKINTYNIIKGLYFQLWKYERRWK